MKNLKIKKDFLTKENARLSQSLIPVDQLKSLKGGSIVEEDAVGI